MKKAGLLSSPAQEENGYREYTDEEIRILKLVEMLRMLDMPIEQIKLALVCPQQMPHLLAAATRLLEEKLESTKYALCSVREFEEDRLHPRGAGCGFLFGANGAASRSFFGGWVSDYKSVKQYQHEKTFTFTPDDAINRPLQLCKRPV